jgi:MoaA/NifB/PqqE/SkfB family radical SAM enzyme
MSRFLNYFTPGIKYLILRVTNRCNASCSFCLNRYYESEADPAIPELSVEEYSRIARKIKGLCLLNLSGGEPYLREDLFPIASEFVRHSGVNLVSSATNGSFPERIFDFAQRMLSTHSQIKLKIGISIDAVGDAHEQIRGIRDGYAKALESAAALKELKKSYPNLMVLANTTVSRENLGILDQVVDDLSSRPEFDGNFLTLVRGPTDDTSLNSEEFEVFRRAYLKTMSAGRSTGSLRDKLFRSIVQGGFAELEKSFHGKRNSFACQAGRKMINISERGNVCICEVLGDPVLGNLRDHDYDLQRILDLQANKERIAALRANGCNCHWDCAILGSLMFGGFTGYRKILLQMLAPGDKL